MSVAGDETATGGELQREQRYLDVLYARLDVLRDRTARALARIRKEPTVGTPGARSERDAFATLHENRLASLRAVEERLCFGRLDLRDGQTRYVGRLGLSDDRHEQLLIDWRASAAEPFYQATAASPGDVIRRRHLATASRGVTGVEDEVLDLAALDAAQVAGLSGEGALLAAVGAHRTGRMRDIVATIQAEQDRVIRAPLPGVLVVQGGPGTGKTAVALHRAAFLLYTYRDRIASSGVLVVGPNRVFLRYIEQVLPALGETSAVLATPGELMPGMDVSATDDDVVAAVKGDLRMVAVLAEAVRQRQRIPGRGIALNVDGRTVMLQPADVTAARARARSGRLPHNRARITFVKDLLDRLVTRYARVCNVSPDEESRGWLMDDLRESRDVRREVNLAWMPLTPQGALADLYADPDRLTAAAPQLTDQERALLSRPRGSAFTIADVPLLDELAELLGEDDSPARESAARAAADRRTELEYAKGVLQMSGDARGMLDAERLVDRYSAPAARLTVAERAATDRAWTFGHVVVDEAQELSAMTWRLLMRRCPSRSMTVVGDTDQTGSASGTSSWEQVLDPYVAGRWRLERLTVNYRTPRQIMAVAADVLAATGSLGTAPTSARDGDEPPRAQQVEAGSAADLVAAVLPEANRLDGGRLAVICADADLDWVRAALVADLPPGSCAPAGTDLDHPVTVLNVTAAKGLEFDAVIVVEPATILAASPRGGNDLYVALTRPTQRLLVLHSGELPAMLARLGSTAPASTAVFDVDGVLADVRHRLPHLSGRPKDWDSFFAAAVDDPPLPPGLTAVAEAASHGEQIVYVTGRPERCRADTLGWLARHGLPPGRLFMRTGRDRRPARLVKLEILRTLAADGPISSVLDDDPDVVKTLRDNGFSVHQATWMNGGGTPPVETQTALFEAQEVDGRT